jgi:2-polyprenyl-3-methyl-5-hydroxy-6-metoxy-1,4-benzoquinol methylase
MLKNTGERIIPEYMKPTNIMLLEHIARYHFSIPYAKGRVLDIACGVGYGTQLTARAIKGSSTEIVGMDVDVDTITYAKGHYYHPLINYRVGDAIDPELPNKIGQFDTIISFETLEHVSNEAQFLGNIFRMLKPGGIVVLSTPFGQGRGMPTNQRFHVHQFTEKEFTDLFKDYSSVSFYYQKGVLIEPKLAVKRAEIHYPMGIAVCEK